MSWKNKLFNTKDSPMMIGRFNIHNEQKRTRDFIHNGGWYDKTGKKIGFGDLDISDLKYIRDNLQEGEIFIILGESDSFWKFVSFEGNFQKVSTKEKNPGIKYIREKAKWVIVPGKIYHYSKYNNGIAVLEYQGRKIQVECVKSFKGII